MIEFMFVCDYSCMHVCACFSCYVCSIVASIVISLRTSVLVVLFFFLQLFPNFVLAFRDLQSLICGFCFSFE